MKRVLGICLVALATSVAGASGASATIHPLVESADCANEHAAEHQPIGIADPPGQTPGFGSHSDQSSLRAVQSVSKNPQAAESAMFGHKLDGQCGHVGGH